MAACGGALPGVGGAQALRTYSRWVGDGSKGCELDGEVARPALPRRPGCIAPDYRD